MQYAPALKVLYRFQAKLIPATPLKSTFTFMQELLVPFILMSLMGCFSLGECALVQHFPNIIDTCVTFLNGHLKNHVQISPFSAHLF